MTLDDPGDFDEAYLSKLSESDLEQFREIYEEQKESLNVEDFQQKVNYEVENYETHLELIKASIAAFPQSRPGSSGFEFAFTEPLTEDGVSNGDVLLAKSTDEGVYLCIIEAKGGDYNRSWIRELSDIREALDDEKQNKLLNQLGGADKDLKHIQLVVLAKSSEASEAERQLDSSDLPSAAESEEGVRYDSAVWGCDIYNDAIHHVTGDVADKDLADSVKSSVSYSSGQAPINYILSDHALIQLRDTVFRVVRDKTNADDEEPLEFEEETFHEVFDEKIHVGFTDDSRDDRVRERSDWLLEKAQRISIVSGEEDDLKSDRDYRIIFRGSTPPTAQEATEDKYYSHEARKKRNEEAFEKAKDDFDEDQSELGEF